ncbi:MAG: NAD(P)-dependent oxidoreductase [Hyphomicrobiales bacterium]
MTSKQKKKLLIFGMGYVGTQLAAALTDEFEVVGTGREVEKTAVLKWNGSESSAKIESEIVQADAILCSIPPHEFGDVVCAQFGELIKNSGVKWLGYLSTTGVYGDHQGGDVDEDTPLNPQNARAKKRVLAENQWASLMNLNGTPDRSVNIFRLPGIYGLGRSAFDAVKAGRAKRIDMRLEDGRRHFFCRAHVDDIVQVISASLMKNILDLNIYNIVDDLPAPQADIVQYASEIMKVDQLPLVNEQDANMSDMAKSFYAECKNMQNDKLKNTLGVTLKYPTYKEGLTAIWQQIKT